MRKMCWGALASLVIACTPGAVTKPLAARPTLSPATCEVGGQSEPLIVEWSGADRARLEAMARKGLIVVRYEGCKLQLLPACKTTGKYDFAPLTKKRERVTIKDANDLYAKIPVGAAGLEGKLQQSGELNVDMMIVGRFEADHMGVRQDELTGDCQGATHVVTGLTTGAFRFFSGASADVSGSVTVMGAGTGGSSSSVSELLNEDGNFGECSTEPQAKSPPSGCGSLMRLEVAAIGEEMLCPPKMVWKGKACQAASKCPRGTWPTFGSCAALGATYSLSVACESSDLKNCEAECTSGNAESCAEMSWQYVSGTAVAHDLTKTVAFARKACDLGSMRACGNLSNLYISGEGVPVDNAKALSLLTKSCDAGWMVSCASLAEWYISGTHVEKDLAKATTLSRKACDGGNVFGCSRLGGLLAKDDPAGALAAYQRACNQGAMGACGLLALEYANGSTMVAKDEAKAVTYARKACDGGVARACSVLGTFMAKGGPSVPKDVDGAARLFTQACNADYAYACYRLGLAYDRGHGVKKDHERAELLLRKSCEKGEKSGCEQLEKREHAAAAKATKAKTAKK